MKSVTTDAHFEIAHIGGIELFIYFYLLTQLKYVNSRTCLLELSVQGVRNLRR